nr:DUF3040 domain-containing protein [Georgenia yuyongxinii]
MPISEQARYVRAWPPGQAAQRMEDIMSLWLILIIVGVVMLILGVAVEAAHILIWIGIAIVVISLIMTLVSRGRTRV